MFTVEDMQTEAHTLPWLCVIIKVYLSLLLEKIEHSLCQTPCISQSLYHGPVDFEIPEFNYILVGTAYCQGRQLLSWKLSSYLFSVVSSNAL